MRSGMPRLAGLLLLSVLPIVAGCQSSAKKHLYKAEDMFEKKDLKGAQTELREAIKEDPNLLDAHKSLAHIDEYLGDFDEAAREFQTASTLDPTDQKLLAKARYYRYVQQIGKQADAALDKVKSGDVEQGMSDIKDALKQTKSKSSRDQVISDLQQAVTAITQQGDKLVQDKKYIDAAKGYEQAVRGYMLLAEAQSKQTLDSAADKVMHDANEAAQKGGAPDMLFKLYNDVLGLDPDNKTANIELAQVYMHRNPPDYSTAADLEERAGAPDNEVKQLRVKAKRHH